MSTPTVIQSCAALYGIVPGAAGVTFVNGQIGTGKAFATEDAMLNHYYESTFTVWAPKTTAQVADLIVANLGLTGATATSEAARIAGLLDGVAMPARGAKVKEIVTAFEATPAAATFNTAKAALVTAVADPTYQGIPDKGVGELVFASLSPAQIQLGTSGAINTVLLTTGVDTVPGSTATDVITGGVASLASNNSLQVTDQIDGAGGRDSLDLAVSTNFAGFSGGGFLKNVETVNLTSSVLTAQTFTAKAVSGVEAYNVKGHVNVENIDLASVVVNLANIAATTDATTANAVNVKFIDEVTTGSSTKATVGVSGLGSISSASVVTPVHILTPGVEQLTVNATGSGTSYVNLASTGLTSVTATGSGGLRINDLVASTGVKSVDASAMTGAFDVSLLKATNVALAKGGAANDVIRINATSLTPTAVIDGGAGTDTLRVDAATALVGAYSMTGVETVRLGTIANTATIDLTKASGVTSIFVSKEAAVASGATFDGANASSVTAGKSTITGLGETASVTIEADISNTPAAHLISFENTGAATVTIGKSSAAVSAGTSQTATDDVLATKATALTLEVPQFTNWSGAAIISASAAKSITVSGKGDFGETNSNVIYAPVATALTIDQQDVDQSWLLQYDSGTASTSPLKTLTVSSVGTVVFDTTTDLLSKLQVLDVKNSKPFTSLSGAAAEIATVSAVGSGSAASFTLGNLGGTSLAYPISVTASGQAANLIIGSIDVGQAQSVTLNIGGVTGDTTIATTGGIDVAATASGANTGSITINASGHGAKSDPGDLTLGTLTAGTVTVDVTGAKGAVATGAITGNAITFKASSAESTVKAGSSDATLTLTARNSVTVDVPLGKATTVDTTISSGSTAFTGALQGSVTNDTVKFVSASTGQTSITLTGDLQAGTDSVTVTSELSTVSTGQTIDISALAGVTSSTLKGALQAKNTIKGGAGKDTIHGGTKADVLTGGAGADTFVLNRIADTGTIPLADLTSSGKFGATKSVTTIELDVITDFSAGDVLRISGYEGSTVSIATSGRVTYGTTVIPTAEDEFLLNGSYNAASNTFTTSTGGVDSLFLYDSIDAGAGLARAIVLVGFGTGLDSADATGAASTSSITGLLGTAT